MKAQKDALQPDTLYSQLALAAAGSQEVSVTAADASSPDDITAEQLYAAGIVPGTITDATGEGKGNMALGDKSKINAGDGMSNNTAIGYNSRIQKYYMTNEPVENSTVVGANAEIDGSDSVAVGAESSVTHERGVAVGRYAQVQSENSIAIGYNAKINGKAENSIAIGNGGGAGESVDTNAKNSTVIGIGGATNGEGAVVLGYEARVDGGATNSTVIGKGAKVNSGNGSVAIGTDSSVSKADVKNDTEYGVVSVGRSAAGKVEGFTRRIVNVSDGVNDTDAATVGQIKTMTGMDEDLGTVVQYDDATKNTVTFQSTDKAGTTLKNVNDIEMNVETYLSGTSIVQGYKTVSFKDAGIIPGTFNGTAANQDTVVLGRDSKASAAHSVVIGGGARAIASNTVSVGTGANADANNSMAIGSGSKVTGTAAVNGTAVGTGSQVTDKDGTALGYHAYAWGEAATVIGDDSRSWADGGTTLGQNACIQTGADNSVALGKDSYVSKDDILSSDANGVVSVGVSAAATDDTGTGVSKNTINRRIINVADGVNDNDAATVGQISKITGMDATKGNVVQYDDEDKGTITLAGENGTKLTGLAAGTFEKDSTDAVTAGQLFAAGIVPGELGDGKGVNEDDVTNGIAIGEGSYVKNKGGLAIGVNAMAGSNSAQTATGATAIGNQSKASADSSVAVGYKSDASGKKSVAIGHSSIVSGEDSTAVGYGSKIENYKVNATAIGSSSQVMGDNGTAVGKGSIVGNNSIYSTALGRGSYVYAGSAYSEALGANSIVKLKAEHAVALGSDSIASETNTVSVGVSAADATADNPELKRRIVNVADGINDSDAATVGQIKTMTGLDTDKGNVVQYDNEDKSVVTLAGGEKGTKLTNLADGDFTSGSKDAVTAGQLYAAGIVPGQTVSDSIAIGEGSTVDYANSIAIGKNADVNTAKSVVIGNDTESKGAGAVVIGQESAVSANSPWSTAIGYQSEVIGGLEGYATAVGANSSAGKATATAVGGKSNAGNYGAVAVGYDSQATGYESVAIGRESKATMTNNVALGFKSEATGVFATALGQGSQATATDSVALGQGSIAGEANTLSIGNDDLKRRIVNVAKGKADTDAATVGQIKTMTGLDTTKGNVVQYDGEDKSTVTLAGEHGTKLTNLAAGEFKEGSTDAVTAGQLYAAGIVPGNTRGNAGSVAMGGGYNNYVLGEGGTAIGYNAGAGENAVAVGNSAAASHTNATAVGQNSNAMENGATALGQHAWAEVTNSTAIGYHADVEYKGDNSVALGANSIVATEDILDTDTAGVVSVGSSGNAFKSETFNRRIINVADGIKDTDAATVGQIKTITGIDSAKGNVVQYDDENKDQITFGGANGTALLNISKLSAKTATIGNISFTDDGRITGVTGGQADSDVATVGQIKNLTGLDSTQGNVVQYDKNGNLNVGVGDSGLKVDDSAASLSHGSNSISVGADGTTVTGDLNVTGDLTFNGETVSSTDLANAANVAGDVSDIKGQIGAGTDGKLGLTNEQATLVGGINANTDAINGVKTIVGNGELDNGAADLTAGINANSAAIEQNRNAIGALGSRVTDLGEEIDSVGAISAALAGLHPLDYDGTGSKFQISAALGTYDGTQAAAIGGFYHFNRDMLLSIGGSTSFEGDRKTAANIGFTFRVGEGAEQARAVQDKETEQKMDAMAQEIEMLKAEIEQLKNKDKDK